MRAVNWITGVGAIPTVCVFRPLRGTDFAGHPVPATEEVLPVFQRLYAACMEHRLPIGTAPNLHVSLVMLPDECRWLQDDPNRYWASELTRSVMRRVFARRLRRELSAAA
jgi:hypothetical protein